MIDAISLYSSSHDGRYKTSDAIRFGRMFEQISDHLELKKKPEQTELGAFLFVSGCAGAISMITETLVNAGQLLKSNTGVVKSIFKNAAIWAAIGGACFGFFRALEHVAINEKTSDN